MVCTCDSAASVSGDPTSMSGATNGLEGGTRSSSMVCAKKHTLRLHLGPSLHSWLRYLCGTRHISELYFRTAVHSIEHAHHGKLPGMTKLLKLLAMLGSQLLPEASSEKWCVQVIRA